MPSPSPPWPARWRWAPPGRCRAHRCERGWPCPCGCRWPDLLRGEICRRHRGLAVGLVFGAARAGEEEPQAAEELLTALVKVGDLDVMEALAEFRREQLGGEIGATAARQAVARLRATS